ncbi:unnamed protein product [Amoebophrya sp. A120]|nr:unnamed protein product [Amoebophrya sp. A120]|eukprot:GSA120T00014938001.1
MSTRDPDVALLVGHPAVCLLENETLSLAELQANLDKVLADLATVSEEVRNIGTKIVLQILQNILEKLHENNLKDNASDAGGHGSSSSSPVAGGAFSFTPRTASPSSHRMANSAATFRNIKTSHGSKNYQSEFEKEKASRQSVRIEELATKLEQAEVRVRELEKERVKGKKQLEREVAFAETNAKASAEAELKKMRLQLQKNEQKWREEKAQLQFLLTDGGNMGPAPATHDASSDETTSAAQHSQGPSQHSQYLRKRVLHCETFAVARTNVINGLVLDSENFLVTAGFTVWKQLLQIRKEKKRADLPIEKAALMVDEQWKLAVRNEIGHFVSQKSFCFDVAATVLFGLLSVVLLGVALGCL